MHKPLDKDFRFVSILSSQVDVKFKNDFIRVCCEVFGENAMNEPEFNRKYIENIYGDSILVVVYFNDIPVAARAFWRNDINGKRAFQPADTCVIQEYRNRGIFVEMTNIVLKMLKKEDIIYNFPNRNSYPQYIKLGWKNVVSYRPTIMTSVKQYEKEHPYIIDNEYLKWWIILKNHDDYYIAKKGNNIFLTKKRSFNRYYVIGRINSDMAHFFKNTKFPILLYLGAGKKFYNKNRIPLNVVAKLAHNVGNITIPIYKMDVI